MVYTVPPWISLCRAVTGANRPGYVPGRSGVVQSRVSAQGACTFLRPSLSARTATASPSLRFNHFILSPGFVIVKQFIPLSRSFSQEKKAKPVKNRLMRQIDDKAVPSQEGQRRGQAPPPENKSSEDGTAEKGNSEKNAAEDCGSAALCL